MLPSFPPIFCVINLDVLPCTFRDSTFCACPFVFFQQQVPSELIYCVILYITTDHNSDRTQHILILLPHYFCSKSIRYEVKRALLSTYWSVCLLIAYIKTPLVSSGSVMIILSCRKRQPQRLNASRHPRSGDTENQPKGFQQGRDE